MLLRIAQEVGSSVLLKVEFNTSAAANRATSYTTYVLFLTAMTLSQIRLSIVVQNETMGTTATENSCHTHFSIFN